MNNSHMRTHVSKGASALQPVGTTSNEALHAGLRDAFWQVYDLHVPVMRRSQDDILTPVLSQTSPRGRMGAVVCRRARYYFPPHSDTAAAQAPKDDAARTRLWGVSSVKNKTKAIKRTVFTRVRLAHLTSAGAHWRGAN